jgi:hypothetical protein
LPNVLLTTAVRTGFPTTFAGFSTGLAAGLKTGFADVFTATALVGILTADFF